MDASDDDPLATLHEELAATEELPVSREAAAWIGEARAVPGDLRRKRPPPSGRPGRSVAV